MATEFEHILEQAQKLSPEERLRLIARLQTQKPGREAPRRRWREIAGAAPGLMQGMDAQDWVSKARRDADAEREPRLTR